MARVRVYDFEIPPEGYDIGRFYMDTLVSRIKNGGAWDRIPVDLQARMESGETVVHKADLDRIDESLWGWIANMGGLSWHIEERSRPKSKARISKRS